ncbi:MAG: hypothetical protein REJ24_03800 [Rhodocyclaceae bacterium]|nr:hypothetical protein [Pseudomonadota bacterium]MDQ7971663.1 hypothetical protein [Rhodocyclaceae bacterium]MDQ7999627.1 hypothetical protein [Pseudomonadota bacterium]MDQ8017849.1 hypothetical protein [Pseudomonadota bacterium]
MSTPEVPDMAAAQRTIDTMLARFESDDAFEPKVTWRERMAARKCLASSRMLMGVVHQLMCPLGASHPQEAEERLTALLDDIKSAAHGAYAAGLLLTGVD